MNDVKKTLSLAKIKKEFPWFKNNPNWTYLDSSATSLKPQEVIEAEIEYYAKLGVSTHNTDSDIAQKVNDLVKTTRSNVAKFINASYDEISFNSGATEGLNLIANTLKKKLKKNDEIVLAYSEHASNLLPWIKIANNVKCKLVYVGDKKKIPDNNLFLKAITKNTKIVTFCNISNVFAYNIDINKITEKIKEINKNIIIVIDATQSIPHMKIDTKKANIDYLVFSGHKMLGPTGIGVLYCNKKHLLTTEPLRLGGGMNTNVTKNSFTFANAPDKFEGGTHNIAGIIGLNAAINFINRIGIENIEEHEMKLKNYINKKFSEIKNIEFYNSFAKFPICIFNMKGIYPQDLASFLAHNKIIVRSGTMCAKLQHNISNNEVGYVRASFYLYNDEKDVDKLVKLLKNFKKGDILKHVIK